MGIKPFLPTELLQNLFISPLTETVMQSIMAKILPCTVHEKQHISFGKSIKQQKEIKKKSAFPA